MDKTSRHRFAVRYYDQTDKVGYRGTRPFIEFALKETDQYHTVADYDRIDLLAYKYYGDCSYWWIIAEANDISNPLHLETGKRLRIPAKSTVYRLVMEV